MGSRRIAANDVFQLSNKKITDEGFLVAPASNIARTGTQVYRAYELGLDHLPPMQPVRLYRAPEEVFAPDSMASFDGKPLTIDHPKDLVNKDNWANLAKGDARRIMRNTEYLAADITMRSADAIAAYEDGKAELSNGYTFDLDMTAGTAPDGTAYDGVQRNIRGNHIALVDAARCGSACRISDSQPEIVKDAQIMPTQSIVVDGIPLSVGDTEAAVINRLLAERNKATTDAAATATAHAATVASKDKEISDLRAQVMTPAARDAMVADWAGMLVEAKRIAPTITTDGKTCEVIRREVLTHLTSTDSTAKPIILAILGGKSAGDAAEPMVRAAFNAAAAATPKEDTAAAQANDGAAAALAGMTHTAAGDQSELSGREKFQQASFNAWQSPRA